jgi:arylsulfatase
VAPHTEINGVFSAEDWVQTLTAAAGEPDIKNKLLKGYDAAGKNFKVHLDGYDQRDMLGGKGPDPRREFFYWTDDGNFAGLRYDQYKAVFMEQPGTALRSGCSRLFRCGTQAFNLLRPIRAQNRGGGYDRWVH